MSKKSIIEVSGAGPAGLAAALAIVASGRPARVYEKQSDVGHRFHGDFQGLENWTTDEDVLQELDTLGISTTFEHTAVREIVAFDPDGKDKIFRSQQPMLYLVRRGGLAGSLDYALKKQALANGVDIRFDTRASHLPNGGVVTEGPHRADAIAAGYLFDTDMADGIYAAISDDLAPKGYAYLLINQGRGTLASCMFEDFHNEREYVDRCFDFFDRHVGLRMNNKRRFGGSGNFSIPKTTRKGNILYAGEAAGFQDPLFGFGIRWALLSGHAAGSALAIDKPEKYEQHWKQRQRLFHQTATSNRWFYERMGNRGYRKILQRFSVDDDVRSWLHRSYAPRLWKRIWFYLVASRRTSPLLNIHEGCTCTWCRCKRHMHAPV